MQIFSELLTRSSLHWDNFLASCMERERNTTKIQAYSQLTCICWLAQRLGWPTQGLATSTFQQNVHCSWKIICDQNICVSLFLPFCLHIFNWAVMAAKFAPYANYSTKKFLTGTNGLQKEFAQLSLLSAQTAWDTSRMPAKCSFPFCKHSFDRAFIVAKWNDLHVKTQENRAWNLPWASNEHVTTWSISQQCWRSPKLLHGLNPALGKHWSSDYPINVPLTLSQPLRGTAAAAVCAATVAAQRCSYKHSGKHSQ